MDREVNNQDEGRVRVLVNAYAVAPNWGSEQGMGWNWVTNLARRCEVFVITEGEWKDEILEAVAKLPQGRHLHFYFNPVSDEVRRMCWNQGDWRFYWHYRKWQERTLALARRIVAEERIQVLHQLNMIGFREPGSLWKIKDLPLVWGPVGGMDLMPEKYLVGAPLKQRLFNKLKNRINKYQYLHSGLVKKAIRRSDALVSAVKGVQDVLRNVYGRESVLINETGVTEMGNRSRAPRKEDGPLNLIWVGKFDFRKQLPLALRSVAATGDENIRLHVCGTGNEETVREMKSLAESLGIAGQCVWHGKVDHDKIMGIMEEADLMFFTSIMDATSTVVLEAVSVGLPVLCFNTCGYGPIVKDFAGITVELSEPVESVERFAEELRRVNRDRGILDEISKRIEEKRDCLTWESKAEEMERIYREVLSFKS